MQRCCLGFFALADDAGGELEDAGFEVVAVLADEPSGVCSAFEAVPLARASNPFRHCHQIQSNGRDALVAADGCQRGAGFSPR